MNKKITRHLVHPFAPVIDSRCHFLILGTFASVQSVQKGFYYGNPQNRFYKVLGTLLKVDLVSLSWDEKKHALLNHHIALADIIHECTIEGSDDSTIRDVIPLDLNSLLKMAPIQSILCNGKKSFDIAQHNYPQTSLVLLPSTSAANASCDMKKLIEAWGMYIKP